MNQLRGDVQSVQQIAGQGAADLILSERSGELDALLTRTAQDLDNLRELVGPSLYVAPLFSWLPRYGGDLANAPALFDYAEQLIGAAQATLGMGRSLGAGMDSERASGVPIGVALLRTSEEQAVAIDRAQQELAQSTDARHRIDAAELSPSLREGLDRLDRWLPLWKTALDVLAAAPPLLGADRPRTYLLLAQNSDELRATGGFISGVAQLRVERGGISFSDYEDSYAVDNLDKLHPTPPEALHRYMDADQWLLRDANWSPDFPTTARIAENLYRIDRGVAVDGVIAVDLQAIPRLLTALGPMTLEGKTDRVDSSNVLAEMQAYWSAEQGQSLAGDGWQHRKDLTGRVFASIMQRISSGDYDRAELSRALYDLIIAKDLLVYINDIDSEYQPSLPRSGSLYRGTGDALMVVDSNVGFNKVDGNVDRQAQYSVTFDPSAGAEATLVVTYTNLSPATGAVCIHQPYYAPLYADLQQGCYWNYVRAVAPGGSKLLRTAGLLDPTTEAPVEGRTVFAGYFVLPRGESIVVRFEYLLPSTVKDSSRYELRLEKQPGGPAIPTSVLLTLPEGWIGHALDPPRHFGAENVLDFQILLDRDRQVTIVSQPSPGIVAEMLPYLVGATLFLGAAAAMKQLTRRKRSRPP